MLELVKFFQKLVARLNRPKRIQIIMVLLVQNPVAVVAKGRQTKKARRSPSLFFNSLSEYLTNQQQLPRLNEVSCLEAVEVHA